MGSGRKESKKDILAGAATEGNVQESKGRMLEEVEADGKKPLDFTTWRWFLILARAVSMEGRLRCDRSKLEVLSRQLQTLSGFLSAKGKWNGEISSDRSERKSIFLTVL